MYFHKYIYIYSFHLWGSIELWLTRLATHPEIERSNRADTHKPHLQLVVVKYLYIEGHNVCEPATIQARGR